MTDAHDPAVLGVIRAFGRAGHQVIAAHLRADRPPLCLSSRFCSGGRVQPDAGRHPAEFAAWLSDRVREDALHAVAPISPAAIAVCAHARSKLPSSLLLLSASGPGSRLSPSDWLRNAASAGIRTPRTWIPHGSGGWSEHGSDALVGGESLPFPVVLRAADRMDSGLARFPGRAYYCATPGVLSYVRNAMLRPHRDVFVQDYLPGEPEYALLLRQRGEVRMHFACRFMHGSEPWRAGTASLVCMEDAGLVQDAAALLVACDYEGLAGVEFCRDSHGERCLVGVDRNPWIGAAVALRAGYDFPGAWLDALRHEDPPAPNEAPWRGSRHALAQSQFIAAAPALPRGGPEEPAAPRLTLLRDRREASIKGDRFCWSDPLPGPIRGLGYLAGSVDRAAQRLLAPMIHYPGRSRLLAHAAGLAERAKSPLELAAARRDALLASRHKPAFHGPAFALPAFPLRIFMFHAVVEEPLAVPHYCFVERSLFRRQLELIRRHYRVLPLSEAVRRLQSGDLRQPSAAITFDDGFENNFTVAYPELQRLELPAAIFVATGFTDSHQTPWFCRVLRALADTRAQSLQWQGRRYALAGRRAKILSSAELMPQLKRLPPDVLEADLGCIESLLGFEARAPLEPGSPFRMLGAAAIGEMAASGLMEFGGHTATHAILSNLAIDGQRREIKESLSSLGRILGGPCRLFAYPNGRREDFDEPAIECLKQSGVSAALTATPGVNPWFRDVFELRRDAVGPPDLAGRFEVRVERMVRIDRLYAGAAR